MDVCTRILMEGNLANEVGLIVLDTIELFCGHFKVSALIAFLFQANSTSKFFGKSNLNALFENYLFVFKFHLEQEEGDNLLMKKVCLTTVFAMIQKFDSSCTA